jgi:hypothetical protein
MPPERILPSVALEMMSCVERAQFLEGQILDRSGSRSRSIDCLVVKHDYLTVAGRMDVEFEYMGAV